MSEPEKSGDSRRLRRPKNRAQPTARIATRADRDALYWHVLEYAHTDLTIGEPDIVEAAQVVNQLCRGEGGVAGVIEENGEIVASVGIRAFKVWFLKNWWLEQLWLYVEPNSRRNPAYADALLEFGENHRRDMASELGYDVTLLTSVMSETRLAAKLRLWRKYGKQIGGLFISRGNL